MEKLAKIAGKAIRRSEEFRDYVKQECIDIAYCEAIAVSTKHFGSAASPAIETNVTTEDKVSEKPFGTNRGALLFQFTPEGTKISYTAQAANLWIAIDDSHNEEAMKVFERAVHWWTTFLKQIGILTG